MITKQFLKIRFLSFNINILNKYYLYFLILRCNRINEVRLQNLYPALVNIDSNSSDNTG